MGRPEDDDEKAASRISRPGLAKRASREAAWAEVGVRLAARVRLVGRRERGSADVGIDSGMLADIVLEDCGFCDVRVVRGCAVWQVGLMGGGERVCDSGKIECEALRKSVVMRCAVD